MAGDSRQGAAPREIRTVKPGDRVLRVRAHRHRLPVIERRVGGPILAAIDFFADLLTQTPVLPIVGVLGLLVVLAPLPIYLFEQAATDPQMTSYWVGLWWAVSAMTTVGHSNVELLTVGGRIVGSIYTVLSVGLFFGSVIAAFSSYFLLTWRRPKRQLVDTVNYYLQRIDELTVEELEDLDDITQGLLHMAKERAELEKRHSPSGSDEASSSERPPSGRG
jgi:voltage-gated potassium channel